MKKTILSAFVVGAMTLAVHAQENNYVIDQVDVQNDFDITLQFGITHSESAEYYNQVDNVSYIPTILYGVSVAGQWEISAHESASHHVGFSFGYYTGDEQFDMINPMTQDINTSLDMIPLLLTYNYMYQLNDRISVYAGIRGGVTIRKTSFEDSVWDYGNNAKYHVDDSSTKVLPTVGVGIGANVAITPDFSFDIGYDFSYTFGDSCGKIYATNGAQLNESYYSGKDLYYGTIKVGFSYSF